jgi:CHAD domain-containing protein
MSESMRKFAQDCVGSMVDQTAFQLANVAKSTDEESVHKLRVSIRRLQQALRLFEEFLNEGAVRRLRKQVKAVLKQAAEVRNRDISSKLFDKSGAGAELQSRLGEERKRHMRELTSLVRQQARTSGKWRSKLGLA